MLINRIIPILLLKNGYLVRSQSFFFHQYVGNPFIQLERYNEWNLDELIYLDITRDDNERSLDILKTISKKCFMPLTYGGSIKTIKDIEKRLNYGADKITLNTQAILTPDIITQAAQEFGQQAIIVSIDIKEHSNGQLEVFSHNGQTPTSLCPFEWLKEVEARGAGEILIQFIDIDGMASGYNLPILKKMADLCHLPIIACSGAGCHLDFIKLLTETNVSAAAAGNIFLFKELAYYKIKDALSNQNITIRRTEVLDY